MPLPRGFERNVLKAIQGFKVADSEAIATKLSVSPTYVEEVCQALIEYGFVFLSATGKYKLTAKGETFSLLGKYIVAPHRAEQFHDF